jgi:uncharacterized protein (DUF885 family)
MQLMHLFPRASLLLSLFVLAACDSGSSSQSSAVATPQPAAEASSSTDVDSPEAETARLTAWLDEQYEIQLDFSPMTRTQLGEKVDYDQLDRFSIEAADEELAWLEASVAEMRAQFDYDNLTADGKISYDMWAFTLEQAQASVPWRNHGYIFGRGGPHAQLPTFMITYHAVETEQDLADYIARLREVDRIFTELLDIAQSSSDQGIRQPAFGYEFALAEIERVTSGVPFNTDDQTPNSPLWTDFQTKTEALVEAGTISDAEAQDYLNEAREVLAGEVLASYESIKSWLETDRQFATEQSQGVWALPNGEDYYNYRLAQMTTLELTAEEIHNTGLQEVARLLAEMEAVKEQTGFEGTLQEFFVFVREDEQFYYQNTDEDRQAYLDINNEYLDAINERLPEFFGRLPKAPLVVRRVEPFREQDGAAQHYFPGSPDGSRPGVFYSHMSDMSSLAKWQIEDIAYHEGNPGHHMQISIQQELTDIPRFRTQYWTTAYVEGWGLYSEWLAKEMGGFQDPYSDFGRLAGEMWRAIRLVVDTGIHAMQWTEQQAVDYFLANSPIPESAVRSEVQRYFATPGQATAYKIGMMNIQEARARAEQRMGDQFDIRGFHDTVLGAGGLPMPMLHAHVDRWVEDTLAGN